MASIFTVTAIVILISIFGNSERGHFLEYPNYHQSPGFHYWQNDKKELGGRVDKIARRHQIEAASRTGSSLLQEKLTNGRVEWQKQVKEGRSEVLDRKRNKELHIIRRQLLGKKLKLKNAQPKRTNDHLKIKPKINSVSSNILKRETSPINHEPLSIQPVKQQSESNLRLKRDVLINPQVQPEVFMQPHIQPPVQQEAERKSAHPGLSFHFYNPSIYYPEVIESLSNRTEPYQERIKEKRNKRQVVYLINKHPQKFLKIPRTTPNPFIREANIEEYDIVRPDPGLYKPEPDVTENKEADSSYMITERASEIPKTKLPFSLKTSTKNWPETHHYPENIVLLISNLLQTQNEYETVKLIPKIHFLEEIQSKRNDNSGVQRNKISLIKNNSEETVHKRVKRRVNKTLQRKKAKKRKQKQRRVERKRLRMLTHARRLRKQQKSKLARLERHYARMNLTAITANTTNITDYKTQSILQDCNRNSERESEYSEEKSSKVKYSKDGISNKNNVDDSYNDVEGDSDSTDNSNGSNSNSYEDERDKHTDHYDDSSIDDGNDEYEYEDTSSNSNYEDVEYENIPDLSDKPSGKNNNEKKVK